MSFIVTVLLSFFVFSGRDIGVTIHRGADRVCREFVNMKYRISIISRAQLYVGKKSKEVCPWVPSNVACAAFTRTVLKRSTGLILDRESALMHWYEFMKRSKQGGAQFVLKTNKLLSGDIVFYAEDGYLAHTGIYIGNYHGPIGNNTGNVVYKDAVVQNSSTERRILVYSMQNFMKKQGQTFLGAVRLICSK
ncbi:MAG: C40 family peptidase [Parcubacteria group bacterium]|nr:C40 family peptidase [Parcubacteria group bacterium]